MDIFKIYFKDGLRFISSILGSLCLYIFGEPTQFMYILAYVIFLDFLTGTLKAMYLKKLNSAVSRNGILRKIGLFVSISAIHMFDLFMGSGNLFRDLLVNMFIVTELISIIENLSEIGIVIPKFVTKILKIK